MRPRRVTTPPEPISDVLEHVRRFDYSQIPVYDDTRYVGILTTNAIARWLAHQLALNQGWQLDAIAPLAGWQLTPPPQLPRPQLPRPQPGTTIRPPDTGMPGASPPARTGRPGPCSCSIPSAASCTSPASPPGPRSSCATAGT